MRSVSLFRFRFAQDNLNFRDQEVTDPMLLGGQILTATGLDVADWFSLFAMLATGDFEDVRMDEPFDPRGRGADRFAAFQTDRLSSRRSKTTSWNGAIPPLPTSISTSLINWGRMR
mgnify:CR=1 FL=1